MDLKFDGVLAMYYDQGLAAFKILSQNQGVNFTAGLPIVRTSPDHGTAYEIAGKGVADETSFRKYMYSAIDICRKRIANSSYYLPPLFLITEEDLDVDLTGFVFLTDVDRLLSVVAEELLFFPSSLYVFVSSFSLLLPLEIFTGLK